MKKLMITSEKTQIPEEKLKQGLPQAEALELIKDMLTPYEKNEIKAFETIWTIGKIRVKSSADHTRSDGMY